LVVSLHTGDGEWRADIVLTRKRAHMRTEDRA